MRKRKSEEAAGCCASYWIVWVIIGFILLSTIGAGIILLFFPQIVFGNPVPITPVPPPTPTPNPTPAPIPTPAPTPPGTPGPCCVASNSFPRCLDVSLSDQVCQVAGFESCCSTAWNETCVRQSVLLGLQTCNPQQCCTPNPNNPSGNNFGCNNITIQSAVCAQDPTCCTRTWDKTCVGQAIRIGLQLCSTTDCCTASRSQGCSDSNISKAVCAISENCCWREWSSNCVGTALANGIISNCSAQPCCVSGIPNKETGAFAQGCNDMTTNMAVCDEMPSCCNWQWSPECAAKMLSLPSRPFCIDQPTNDCCNTSTRGGCNSLDFMRKVCVDDHFPQCCGYQNGWSSFCVTQAGVPEKNRTDVPTLRCHFDSCCLVHSRPGCTNKNVTDLVCGLLPQCCTQTWSSSCVQAALQNFDFNETCGIKHSCCMASESAGCNDPAVMQGVCFSPNGQTTCCNTLGGWGPTCVKLALDKGLIECTTRSCCSPAIISSLGNEQRFGCNNATIMEKVCNEDGLTSCCYSAWGQECVVAALKHVTSIDTCREGNNFAGACCDIRSKSFGCEKLDVVRGVCESPGTDYCCYSKWDGGCITKAQRLGLIACHNDTCFEPAYVGGCANTTIEHTVCDPAQFVDAFRQQCGQPSTELTAYGVQKLPSCCTVQCIRDNQCPLGFVCAGGHCCITSSDNVCTNCGCLEQQPNTLACTQNTNGDYICPSNIDGVCVNYNTGTSQSVQCCPRSKSFCADTEFSSAWDAQCAAAALCTQQVGVIAPFVTGNNDCCTPSTNAGCNNATTARAVCSAIYNSAIDNAFAPFSSTCCIDDAQLSQTDPLNIVAGWQQQCVGMAMAIGADVCSAGDCCTCAPTPGCNTASVNQAVCNNSKIYIDSTGKTIELWSCCTQEWQYGCIEYAQSVGALSCDQGVLNCPGVSTVHVNLVNQLPQCSQTPCTIPLSGTLVDTCVTPIGNVYGCSTMVATLFNQPTDQILSVHELPGLQSSAFNVAPGQYITIYAQTQCSCETNGANTIPPTLFPTSGPPVQFPYSSLFEGASIVCSGGSVTGGTCAIGSTCISAPISCAVS